MKNSMSFQGTKILVTQFSNLMLYPEGKWLQFIYIIVHFIM